MAESDIFVSNDIALDVDFGEIFVIDQGVIYKVIAKKYSSEGTYAVGDYVSHLERLYRCITAVETAEPFDEEKWTEVFLADEVQVANNNIALKANAADVYAKTDTYNKTEVNDALAQKVDSADLAAVATSGDYSDLSNTPSLATVATSGSYDDLTDKPTIPAAQVNSDWNASSGVAQILNKPALATVATSGDYDDLTNKPTIPAAQVNSDWNSSSGVSQILNKPNLAAVATSGSYDDLTDKPTIPAAQVQADYGQTDNTKIDYIKNKPNLATVATSGNYNDLTNKPTIPAAQVNSDWEAESGIAKILNKPNLAAVATSGDYTDLSNTPSLATVATSGDYDDLTNKPTIPAAQVNADWNSSSGVSQILNKPTLATVATSGAYADLSGTPTIPDGLADLTDDVNITSPSDGQVLKYDGTSSKWVNGTGGGGGASALDDLTDVDVTSPSEGDTLVYDSANSKWVNGAGGGGSTKQTAVTQAQYDALVQAGTVDPTMEYFITDGIPASVEYYHQYSTSEQVVGKWIDGSTLYEKTLIFNNKRATCYENTSELEHGVIDIGSVKFVTEAYCDFHGGQEWATCMGSINQYTLGWKVGNSKIIIDHPGSDNLDFIPSEIRSYLFTIRYTKTSS